MRGADLVAQALAAAGVRRVFSLSGNQVLSLYDALDRAGIAIIHTRHEGAAVHMADGHARLTGEVGVALVTAATGHANALGALAMAESGETPLVLLSGHAPYGKAGAFQQMDQERLARPITHWAATASSADQLPALLETAFARACAARPGPVSLNLPVDVLEAAAPASSAPSAPSALLDPAHASDSPWPDNTDDASAAAALAPSFREIASRLRAAARPLILAGPSASRPALHAALQELCAHTRLPLVIVDHPRGLTDPALGRAAHALPDADCVLLFGKTQDYRLGYGAALASGATLLQIDPSPEELGRYRPAAVGLLSDLLPAATHLLAAARALDPTPWPATDWTAHVQRLVDTPVAPDGAALAVPDSPDALHPWRVLDALAELLDQRERDGRDVCLVIDGGEFGQWARARLAPRLRREVGRHLVNEPSGTIGYAVPFAIAARLARPDATVIAIAGDGAFGFYAMELETAARAGAPILALVGNDAAWGTERHLQRARYGSHRTIATDLLPARYDLLAQSLGGEGLLLRDAAHIRPTLEQALASVDTGRVTLVNARIASVPSPAGAPP
ncbi:MAG TPA: thiamine pyrophosphate-binding protein [Chloroflexota bacterium]|nr:thiamine pyrophosphate-binding protein [Chloroflexota bacterium]